MLGRPQQSYPEFSGASGITISVKPHSVIQLVLRRKAERLRILGAARREHGRLRTSKTCQKRC